MILIDKRTGSKELFPRMPKGEAKLVHLEYADVAWKGKGPEGEVSVGVERKTINDLLLSFDTGRFTGYQMFGLLEEYDYVYLLVEGQWKPNATTGFLEVLKQKWVPIQYGRQRRTSEVYNMLNTFALMSGIIVWRTGSLNESAQWIRSIYRWWTDKEYHKHRSHRKMREPVVGKFTKPTLHKQVASLLPGIGVEKAGSVAAHFSCLYEMVNSRKEEWTRIEGVGKKGAARIESAMFGGEDEQ